MTIRPGEEWGRLTTDPADLAVYGGDAELARALAVSPGALIDFRPDAGSDLARAVGIPVGGVAAVGGERRELPMDALRVTLDDHAGRLACNLVVAGDAPDRLGRFARRIDAEVSVNDTPGSVARATTLVVATGQFLRGLDVVPRGHPGDGRVEMQLYRLRASEHRGMRNRLTTGTHVPHPRIDTRTARSVELRTPKGVPVEVDGQPAGRHSRLRVEVVPGAYRLLV